jgi:glycine cleavage system transcriptional repressor
MTQYLLITAVGRDRPGLVAGITEALLVGGCNVEDSSMTRLGGDFAMILLVRHAEASPEPIRQRLEKAGEALNLSITMRPLSEEDVRDTEDEGASFHLSVYGADKAGIVHAIARSLADLGASITDLRTTVAGTEEKPIYVMQIEALAPEAAAETLPAAVSDAAARLGVEIAIRRMDPVAL